MLLETFLSVKEIRATLGNIDRSHFSREFRNFCGLTPTEFRKRLNKSQAEGGVSALVCGFLNPRFQPTIRMPLTSSQVLRRPPEVTQVVKTTA
jgi:hypothetical protein